jgi:clusterin-associated protein 1
MESFRTPNFDLVADVLRWLVKRYEPTADVSEGVSKREDRVVFLKSAAKIMQTKGRIKLNMKRLYQADGYAVKELIKISQVLYKAIKSNPEEDDDLPGGDSFTLKSSDLQDVREKATQITQHGSQLAELLAKEDYLREARKRAISRRDDETADIQKLIADYIEQANETKVNKDRMSGELEHDKKKLSEKLEKKKADLERTEKRNAEMKKVRPAFMDEYELLEEQLQDLFRDYLERYRNLDYIEHQLNAYNKKEKERIDAHEKEMKDMQRKIKEEEMKVLRGDVQLDENDLDESLFDDGSSDEEAAYRGGSRNAERPKTKSGARSNVQGSLAGGHDDDDSQSGSDDDLSGRSGESEEETLDDISDQGSDGELSGSDDVSGSRSDFGSSDDNSDHSF